LDQWDAQCLALLEEGSRKESVIGMYYLAYCYYEKVIVELRDYDKAFSLYQRAAQLGNMRAAYMMGQCYEFGRGTKKNYQRAGDCYQYAYNATKHKGYAEALDELYTAQKWDKARYSPDIFICNTAVMRKANLEKLKDDAAKYAQANLNTTDLKILAVSIGTILEEIVNSFVECHENAYLKDSLDEKITLLRNKGYFSKDIANKAHRIRKLRNRGAHNAAGEVITADELQEAIDNIQEIVAYYGQY
jgi:hypothetical protein